MKIKDIHLVEGEGFYYNEDLVELQMKPVADNERYFTPGNVVPYLKTPSRVISIGVELDSGQTHWGDAIGVAYAGKSGRDGIVDPKNLESYVQSKLIPTWCGIELSNFREACQGLDASCPVSLAYGFSQALLAATAAIHNELPLQCLCREWDLPLPEKRPKLHGSVGHHREAGALKLLVRRVDSLPAGQGDDIPAQIGEQGEKLLDYARWLKTQHARLEDPDYHPAIHLDVHGALGLIFDHDLARIGDYLLQLTGELEPFSLRIESPMVMANREEQTLCLGQLKTYLNSKSKKPPAIVVDEWANNFDDIVHFASSGCVDMIHIKMPDVGRLDLVVEAVLTSRSHGVAALLGGSCTETEISTRLSTHIAMATQPELYLCKPGMGVDEAVAMTRNEMKRSLRLIQTLSS